MKTLSFKRGLLEINLSSLKKNCKILQGLVAPSFFCPMVKAEAYGHGSLPVTRLLKDCGVQQVGVTTVEEASSLRHHLGDSFDILIFSPLLNDSGREEVIQKKCIPVCSHWEDLKAFAQKKKIVRFHLKFDTGFSRLGFPLSSAKKIKTFITDNPFLKLEGLCTQLITGSEIADPNSYSSQQIQRLEELQTLFSAKWIHALNTESLLVHFASTQKTNLGARPGIGLYGIKDSVPPLPPSQIKKWESVSLTPTSTLKSYIVDVHSLQKGDKVSYGGRWVASRPSVIATVSLGYKDVFSREWGRQKGEVLFRGQRVPVVGSVCMDFFMIDVTSLALKSPIQHKEEVVLFGKQGENFLSIEEHTKKMRTVSHELFVQIRDQVQREYVFEEGSNV